MLPTKFFTPVSSKSSISISSNPPSNPLLPKNFNLFPLFLGVSPGFNAENCVPPEGTRANGDEGSADAPLLFFRLSAISSLCFSASSNSNDKSSPLPPFPFFPFLPLPLPAGSSGGGNLEKSIATPPAAAAGGGGSPNAAANAAPKLPPSTDGSSAPPAINDFLFASFSAFLFAFSVFWNCKNCAPVNPVSPTFFNCSNKSPPSPPPLAKSFRASISLSISSGDFLGFSSGGGLASSSGVALNPPPPPPVYSPPPLIPPFDKLPNCNLKTSKSLLFSSLNLL